jgi:hypothetical protein
MGGRVIAFVLSPRATVVLLVNWVLLSVIVGILFGRFIKFGDRDYP